MKLVSEIFEEIESTRSINQKKDILSGHQRAGFLSVLQHMFDRNIKFAIKKIPEYRPSKAPLGLEDSYLEKTMKDLRLFYTCLLYTSPSPRDVEESRMPSSA